MVDWARNSVHHSLDQFVETLTKVFDRSAPGSKAARGLRRGQCRVVDYAIEFRKLAVDSVQNHTSLNDNFWVRILELLELRIS